MTKWLFAPGIKNYLPQLSLYCNNVEYVVGTKRIPITSPYCLNVIPRCNCVKFPDIIIPSNFFSYLFFRLICFFTGDVKTVNTNGYVYSYDVTKFNLGQTSDIEAVNDEYKKIPVDEEIIAYGTSRGSVAIVNWMAKHSPRNIKLLILESCLSSMDELLEQTETQTGLKYYVYKLLKFTVPLTTNYKIGGEQAINNITKLPKDLPVLFITSIKDEIIPYQCTVSMYQKMVDHGYTNVHLCILNNCGHTDYVTNNANDRNKYIDAVLTFYNQNNITLS